MVKYSVMVKLILAFLLTFNILAAQSEKSFDYMLKLEGFRSLPYDDATGKTLTRKQVLSGNYKGKLDTVLLCCVSNKFATINSVWE